MKIVVEKYGGSSLGSRGKIFSAAHRIIASHEAGHQMVVVVSAMGATTDDLLCLANQINKKPEKRELSLLLATGEMVSSSLLAMAIQNLGKPAVALTGAHCGIKTDGVPDNARITSVDDTCIRSHLDNGRIVIVAGYQGTHDGEITVLGRGGSDASAVALAAALGADECRIYSDVPGVFSADPRVVREAVLLPAITYGEMVELADSGAQIMMGRAVKIAKENNMMIRVQSAADTNNGTLITGENEVERVVVRGIATKSGIALIDIQVPEEWADKIHQILKDLEIDPSRIMMTSLAGSLGRRLLIQVEQERLFHVSERLSQLEQQKCISRIEVNKDMAQISAVGARISETQNVANDILETLSQNQIEVLMFITTGTRITATIPNEQLFLAARLLHRRLDLHAGHQELLEVGLG